MDVANPQIYDASGQTASLPEDQMHGAIASGKFGFQKGAEIPVINPNGEPVFIPAEFAHQALNNGFTFEGPTAQTERIKTAENSGFVPGMEAFGAGAARGASLGLSDFALTKTGLVRSEKLSDLRKYSPISSLTGEAAGTLASLAVPGSPASLIGKAGKAVSGAVDSAALPFIGQAMEATGLGGSPTAAHVLGAASEIGSHALGSAVEGAIYSGVGNTITEKALGDPDLNGEKIMSNFGYGALLGGVMGGVLKSAEIGLPPAIKSAKNGLISLRDTLIGSGMGEGKATAGLAGRVLPPKLAEAIGNRTINLGVDEAQQVVKDVSNNLNEVHNNIQTAIKELNNDIRPQALEADIQTASPAKSSEARQAIIYQMNTALEKMESRPALYQASAVAKLQDLRDELVNGLKKEDPLSIFNALRDAKQRLGKMVFTKLPTETAEETTNVLRGVSSKVNDTIKDPDIFGHAGASLAAHDEMLSKYFDFIAPGAKSTRGATEFQKTFGSFTGKGVKAKWAIDPKKVELVFKRGNTISGQQQMALLDGYYNVIKDLPEHLESSYANIPNSTFDKSTLEGIIDKSQSSAVDAHQKYVTSIGNNKNKLGLGDLAAGTIATHHPVIGGLLAAYNAHTNPIGAANKLAELERIIGQGSNLTSRGAKSIFNPSVKALEKASGVGAKIWTEQKESHQKLSDKLSEYQHNPEILMNHLTAAVENLHDVAPETASGIQMAAIRASQFLNSKLPSPQGGGMFSDKYEPSPTELAQFNRYYDIVENPSKAFEQVRSGVITPETTETLATVYPKLYDEMKQSVAQEASRVIQKGQVIPYSLKQSISQFLMQPIDEALSPGAIMANQASYAQPQQQQPMMPKKTKKTDMNFASRASLHDDQNV